MAHGVSSLSAHAKHTRTVLGVQVFRVAVRYRHSLISFSIFRDRPSLLRSSCSVISWSSYVRACLDMYSWGPLWATKKPQRPPTRVSPASVFLVALILVHFCLLRIFLDGHDIFFLGGGHGHPLDQWRYQNFGWEGAWSLIVIFVVLHRVLFLYFLFL